MLSPATAVAALVEPAYDALRASDRALAKHHRRGLLQSAADTYLLTPAVHTAWLLDAGVVHGTGVPLLGETHLARWAVQAIGPRRSDDRLPITYGVSDLSHRFRGPWSWDLLRLLTSIDLSITSRPRVALLSTAVCADYQRVLAAACTDDDSYQRIDFTGLPEAVKHVCEVVATPQAHRREWTRNTIRHRLRRPLYTPLRDPAVLRRVHDTVQSLGTVLDAGTSAPDMWLILIREQNGTAAERLLHMEPRIDSAFLAAAPHIPQLRAGSWARPYHVRDPFALPVVGQGPRLDLRTWSHCHAIVSAAHVDAGDAVRLGRLWGQLIATAHLEGIAAEGGSPGDAAHEIRAEFTRQLPSLMVNVQRLSRFYRALHRCLAKLR